MILLLIDTSGLSGSIALADTRAQSILASAPLPSRSASERLVPAIRTLLANHTLGAIAVVYGPGSFTGIRIGVAAAKGLAEALTIPVIAISRLAVLADQALSTQPDASDVLIHTLLDAGRDEFYHGLYRSHLSLGESLLTRTAAYTILLEPDAPALVAACEPAVAQSLALPNLILLPEPTAEDALPIALRRLAQNDFDDIATLDANYLRRSDAQLFARPKPASTGGQA